MSPLPPGFFQKVDIISDTFCDNCGYNLRTLRIIGRCPECGNEYSARPQDMKGIFQGTNAGLPIGDTFGAILCAAISLIFLYRAATTSVIFYAVAAIPFLLMLMMFVRSILRKMGRRFERRDIIKRVAASHTVSESVESDQLGQNYILMIDTFCVNCGFNLKSKPAYDECPKCRERYDARPHIRQGVLYGTDVKFPSWSIALSMVCVGVGFWAFQTGRSNGSIISSLAGLLALALSGYLGVLAILGLQQFIKYRPR